MQNVVLYMNTGICVVRGIGESVYLVLLGWGTIPET